MRRCRPRSLGGLLSGAALLWLVGPPALGQTFSSGSTGADGSFAPACSPTPCTVTVALPPGGIFNFTTIDVPLGVTVTFTRNAANTPAILLAQGGVTLTGTLEVSGGDGSSALGRPGLGGPGGFDGGAGADGVSTAEGGSGLGPGGGGGSSATDASPGGGGYGTAGGGSGGGVPYGTPGLRPMVGGSGGGGGATGIGRQAAGGGGGGGGAIVIASSSSISLNYWQLNYTPQPNVRARGGNGGPGYTGGAGGAGGAILLIAPAITGDGILDAQGGNFGGGAFGATGGSGRIRLETSALSFRGHTSPPATNSFPQPVFPAAGQPSLTITSVGGIPAPASPSGSLLAPPDILLPAAAANPVSIGLAARHVPLGTTIQVTATPQSGARSTATSTGLAGTFASSTATASLALDLTQTSILTATAIFPLVVSAAGAPVSTAGAVPGVAEGDEVTHVRVAAGLGGITRVSYLTRSGREIVAP